MVSASCSCLLNGQLRIVMNSRYVRRGGAGVGVDRVWGGGGKEEGLRGAFCLQKTDTSWGRRRSSVGDSPTSLVTPGN